MPEARVRGGVSNIEERVKLRRSTIGIDGVERGVEKKSALKRREKRISDLRGP